MEQLEKAAPAQPSTTCARTSPPGRTSSLRLRAEWLPTCDETAVRETWQNFHARTSSSYLRKLKPPVLFMYGVESPMVSAAGGAEVVQTNPAFEIVGHPAAPGT